jgi:hypothetical protein
MSDPRAEARAEADRELMAAWPEHAWPDELRRDYGLEPTVDAYTVRYTEAAPELDLEWDLDLEP